MRDHCPDCLGEARTGIPPVHHAACDQIVLVVHIVIEQPRIGGNAELGGGLAVRGLYPLARVAAYDLEREEVLPAFGGPHLYLIAEWRARRVGRQSRGEAPVGI